MLTAFAALGADARAAPKLRVLYVCTAETVCKAFKSRLQGQTSDLNVELVSASVAAPPLPNQLDDAVSQIDVLAAADGAAVALWWRDDEIVALLREPAPGRVLVRRVSAKPSDGKAWRSGTAELEAGALICRSAILAAINHTPIGVARQAKDESPAAPEPTLGPAPAPPPSLWQGSLSVGWNLAWDDIPPEPNHGLAARLGAKRGRLRFGLLWIERWVSQLRVPVALGSIHSRQLGGFASFDVLAIKSFKLALEARFGLLMATVQPLSGPSIIPLRFNRGFVGIGALLKYQVVQNMAAVWIAGAIDRVDSPFNVGLRTNGTYEPLWHMAATQPSVSVGVEVLFPKLL